MSSNTSSAEGIGASKPPVPEAPGAGPWPDPDDLLSLAEHLRRERFDIHADKLLDAQTLLVELSQRGVLGGAGVAGWLPWLMPLFSARADQRVAFDVAFRRWLAARGDAAGGSAAEDTPMPAQRRKGPDRRRRNWILGVALLMAALAGLWAMRCTLGWRCDVPTDASPVAQPDASARRPNPNNAGGPGTSITQSPPPSTGQLIREFELPLSQIVPPLTWRDRLQPWPMLGLLLPWALLLIWAVRRGQRKPQLLREATQVLPQLRKLHLPSGARSLLAGWPLRRIERALRARQWVPSRELRIEPTLAATLRKGGTFTPIFGSRVEAEYLALIDRESVGDHQAQLAAEWVAELARADVSILRFDVDARLQRLQARDARGRGPVGTVSATASATVRSAREVLTLEELAGKHPARRILLIGDGRALFDGFTGEPTEALRLLLAWPMAVLLTPRPPVHWGPRETALQRLGVQVLPFDAAGMAAWAAMLGGSRAADPRGAAATGASVTASPGPAPPPLFEQTPRRWVERDAPQPEVVQRLVADLEAALGRPALVWLAAALLYPEVNWGVSLRLGRLLVPQPATFEAGLRGLCPLPWLRLAYAPDWLRAALYAHLSAEEREHVRKAIGALLSAVQDAQARGSDELPLNIALPPRDRWRGLLRRWSGAAQADHALRDHVFLRFMHGRSDLALEAPATLVERFREARGATWLAAGTACVALSLLSASVWPVWLGGEARQVSSQVWWPDDAASPAWLVVIDELRPAKQEGSATRPVRYSLVRVTPPVAADAANASAQQAAPSASQAAVASGWRADRVWAGPQPLLVAPDGLRLARFDAAVTEVLVLAANDAPELLHRWPAAREGAPRAFSPDGHWLAYVGRDGLLETRSVTGESTQPRDWSLRMGTTGIRKLALAPGARQLALVTDDGDVRLAWPRESGVEPASIDQAGAAGRLRADSLQYDRSGSTLAYATTTGIGIRSLAPGSGSERRLVSPQNADLGLRFARQGSGLLGYGTGILRWSVEGSQLVTREVAPAVPSSLVLVAEEAAEGRLIASLEVDGKLTAYRNSGRHNATTYTAMLPAPGSGSAQLSIGPLGQVATVSGSALSIWQVPGTAFADEPRQWALVIGNTYSSSPTPLQSADADARRMAQLLETRFGYTVDLQVNASRNALAEPLMRLARQVKSQDRVLIYTSGHGSTIPGDWRFPLENGKELAADAANSLSGREMLSFLRALPASEALWVIDAHDAYSVADLAADAAVGVAGSSAGARARWLLAAAAKGQVTAETERGGTFTLAFEQVLQALREPQTATRVTASTAAEMPKRPQGSTAQQPVLRPLPAAGHATGEFQFIPLPRTDNAAATSLRYDIFSCDALDQRAASLAVQTRAALLAAGVPTSAIRLRPINASTWQREFSPNDRPYQLRISLGRDDESAAAKALLADSGFRRVAAWQALTVKQESPGLISVVVCQPDQQSPDVSRAVK